MSNGFIVLKLIRGPGTQAALRRRGSKDARSSGAANHDEERDQCTTILCSMLSPGPSRRGAKPKCRWRNIWKSCRDDPMLYATAAERLLAAIGEPEMVDTAKDARLGRIFMNRTIRVYPAFAEFYGMEETIERIVGFFRHAAQGLEERKQIMYLLGPVGGGKSSLAERLKALMEVHPIYVLKAGDELSPVFESPLGLFDPETHGADAGGALRHSAPPPDRADEPVVPQAARRVRRRHLALPRRQDPALAAAPDRRSPRPNPATRTTRTSPRWSARSTSASWRRMRRTIPTPTAIPAASTAPTRACSNSSRCSRRRSRCCIRC